MKHTNKRGTNGYAIKPKYHFWSSVWVIAFLVSVGVIINLKTQPKIISPLADNPWTESVYAKESPRVNVREIIRKIAGRHAPLLLDIAFCESSFKDNAVSKTGDFGIFQIHLNAHWNRIPGVDREAKIQWLLNPENNILFGYALFLEQGTKPWDSSAKCWK